MRTNRPSEQEESRVGARAKGPAPLDFGALPEEERYDLFQEVISAVGEFDARIGYINVLGIRGYQNGRATEDAPDRYNDTIAVLWRDGSGRHVREYEATVDPGAYWTENPMKPEGVAHLVDGQYLYQSGRHKGRPALVQAGPVTVWRDRNQDDDRDPGEKVETGNFGINIHDGGSDARVGRYSAGCQVVRGGGAGAAWQEFLSLVGMHPGSTIRYTLVDRSALGFEATSAGARRPVAGRSGRQTLRRGNRGTEVRELQRLLGNGGHDPGPIDGVFGSRTAAAVLAFQQANGLAADGIVGPNTWSALLAGRKAWDAEPAPAGARRALVVAINDYGDPRNDLPSCVADARAFREVLESGYGFERADIKTLLDGDAVIEAVDAGLRWLIEGAGPLDRLVFYYSGHGYQLAAGNALEEVLVLRDGFYHDDTLSALTRGLPAGALTVVLDSCFSGGMEKIVFGAVDGSAEFARAKRWVPPPEEFGRFQATAPNRYRAFGQQGGKPASSEKGLPDPGTGPADESGQAPLNGLLLSACSENETASASSSMTRGLSAFTFCLLEAIPSLGVAASTRSLLHAVRDRLKEMGFRQTPLLQEPPGTLDLAARSFLTWRATSSSAETSDPWSRLVALLSNPPGNGNHKETSMTTALNHPNAAFAGDENTDGGVDTKVFGALVGAVLPVVVNGLAQALSRKKKGFAAWDGEGEGDGVADAKGLADAFATFLPPLLDVVTSLSDSGSRVSRGRNRRKDFETMPEPEAPLAEPAGGTAFDAAELIAQLQSLLSGRSARPGRPIGPRGAPRPGRGPQKAFATEDESTKAFSLALSLVIPQVVEAVLRARHKGLVADPA